jgi:tRNA dimethylallyltransferase
MQVFRGMDIGTAKPDPATRDRFGYHMVDVADPSEEFTVAEFQSAGRSILDEVIARNGSIVIAGGSGLHFRSLVDPLVFPPTDAALRSRLEMLPIADLVDELVVADPRAGEIVDLANPRRVIRAVEVLRLEGSTPSERSSTRQAEAVRSYRPVRPFTAIGVDPGPVLGDRIVERFDTMLARGLLQEVADLAPHLGRTARQAVGYRELLRVVKNRGELRPARDEAIRATNALAKRQRTYFRRDPRIRWIPWHHDTRQMLADVLDDHEEGATWSS